MLKAAERTLNQVESISFNANKVTELQPRLHLLPYQQRTPAHTGHHHDDEELADHLKVVGCSSAVVFASQPSLQQGTARQRVAHEGEQQGQQPQHGEEQRQQHIQPVSGLLHVEEAPAPGCLDPVRPPQHHGQRCHHGGQQPHQPKQPLHVVGGQRCGVEERPGDPDAALHGHGAAQQQRAQAEEHNAHPEDAAQDAVRVELLPPLVGAVDIEHQAAIDEVAQQVCDHQAAGEKQEGGLGLEPDAFVGFEQDEEGEAV